MKYKAIIFDLDGTIIDTENIWSQASEQLLNSRGVVLDEETKKTLFNSIRGLATHKSCALIKTVAQLQDDLDALIAEKNERAHTLYKKHVTFIPGFIEFHHRVTAHNLKSGIATNASAQTAELTDQILNLRRFFGEHIYNVSHVNYVNKPDPALYLHSAKQLGIEPINCIAIEDSAHGICAAKAANMLCIGINTSGNPEHLKQADYIVNGYQEIDLPMLLGR